MPNTHSEMILVLDFGSQYTQLIARRIRELNIYCEIHPYNITLDKIKRLAPKGLVLSGGPASVYADQAPQISPAVLEIGVPVLGICYGMQLIAHLLGGKVESSVHREYGFAELDNEKAEGLLAGQANPTTVWMSHGDRLAKMPSGFKVIAKTQNAPMAAIADETR